MILACGTCTHWIVWTAFPAATPWALTFAAWFLLLSLVSSVSRVRLVAVPGLPVAAALVVGSLVLGVLMAGPLAGVWFIPSCLLGTASAVRLGSGQARVRRIALSTSVVAVVVLGALWMRFTNSSGNLARAERVLLLEGTPAWSIELRRVGRGDCATLQVVAGRATTARLIESAEKRLAEECAVR